jgi:hypothetical protein
MFSFLKRKPKSTTVSIGSSLNEDEQHKHNLLLIQKNIEAFERKMNTKKKTK